MNDVAFSIIFFIGLCISFLLSGMEAGLFQLNRLRLKNMGRHGDKRANVLLRYLEQPEQFLWTILVGNILANVTVVAMSAVYLRKMINNNWLFWIAFLIFVFAFYLVCDLVPKMTFRLNATQLCLSLARLFKLIYIILSPIVLIINHVANILIKWTGGKAYTGKIFASKEEIKYFMRETNAGLSKEELMMINRVLDIKDITVKRLTIPFQNVTVVDLHSPINVALELFNKTGYSHLPVIQKKNGNSVVAGIISLRDVIYNLDLPLESDKENSSADVNEKRPGIFMVAHYVKPALFINENVTLEDALKKLQKSGRKIAIVLNAENKEIGIITLNDILGFIFGEVEL